MRSFRSAALVLGAVLLFSGCASVPTARVSDSNLAKSFPVPPEGQSGLYIYRNSFAGKALKKDVWVDGKCLGQTADKMFFYSWLRETRSISSPPSPSSLRTI